VQSSSLQIREGNVDKKYVVVRKIEKVVISGSRAAENSTAPWQLVIINSEFWFICSLRRLQLGAKLKFTYIFVAVN